MILEVVFNEILKSNLVSITSMDTHLVTENDKLQTLRMSLEIRLDDLMNF